MWHVEVVRNLNDCEINEYESFLSSLYSVFLNENYDKLVWSPSLTGGTSQVNHLINI